jgi:hypothetical protein
MEVCGDVKSGTRNSDAPNIGAEYEIAIFDKDGNEKRRFGGKANCFVKGFMDYLWHLARNGVRKYDGITQSTFVKTNGTSVTAFLGYRADTNPFLGGARAISDANVIDTGIVVGRSTTPVTLGDYNVGSTISISELQYGASTVSPLQYSGNAAMINMSRQITNGSSSAVSGISSIAVYVRGLSEDWSFMILRDVVPTFELNPGESAIVIYKLIFNGGS